MLNKCANPDCTAKFLYLREGRLFEFALSGPGGESSAGRAMRREMFWLCAECAQKMSLECSEEGDVTVVPRGKESAA